VGPPKKCVHFPNFKTERNKIRLYEYVAGCDEAGMGPLAGPVVAAVCILHDVDFKRQRNSKEWFARVRDSKTIGESERFLLEDLIIDNCEAFGIGKASVTEIDKQNIHHARLLAMRRAWEALLKKYPDFKKKSGIILIDGKFTIPDLDIPQETFVKGDANIISIAAASILAKNYRDRIMVALHKKLPEYGFAKHKGYGTTVHIKALKKLGSTAFHRKSFLKKILIEK
jgi:ribonuclease HII